MTDKQILPFEGVLPQIDDSAFIATGAVIIGNRVMRASLV